MAADSRGALADGDEDRSCGTAPRQGRELLDEHCQRRRPPRSGARRTPPSPRAPGGGRPRTLPASVSALPAAVPRPPGRGLFEAPPRRRDRVHFADFEEELRRFDRFGRRTRIVPFPDPGVRLPVYVNEFWTAKQRAAHSLHEISYRACFKPQLPRFFISRLTRPGELVHDPFLGRGTTALEAALLGRRAAGNDRNPLSRLLLEPRFDPPPLVEVAARLAGLDLEADTAVRETSSPSTTPGRSCG